MTNPNEWLRTIGANESLREIASKTGVSHATLSRQINDGAFLMDTTIRIARAYNVSPVAALVANGHLTASEAGLDSVQSALELARDEQLVLEIARRLDVTELGSIYDAPLSEAVSEATMHEFPTHKVRDSRQDDRMVANESIEEFPQTNDTDFDNA
ncbi:MAG: helix-turn-helix transcriptional regulator [Actinobacteria bacterium]|nr:helix-turn-helix transcriptional regulator [Actinomycetota bacterium]